MSAGSTFFDLGKWQADAARDEHLGPVVQVPPKHAAPGAARWTWRRLFTTPKRGQR